MIAARRAFAAASLVLLASAPAAAQQVFTGDPVDSGTGLAYPVMPGLPLLLPGGDEDFGTGDDILNTGITGDVDLVVRVGSISAAAIPAPALAAGGPALSSTVAGGGSSGLGAEAAFTVMVSDGTGSPAYGNVVTATDLDLRPVTVYAFADLDDDGVIGPTNADGSADNAFELQEATAYAGRQMGTLWSGRFEDSLGIRAGAPSSMGGLRLALVAGAYTGSDAEALFTDGTLILTRWPLFPPLDPKDLLGGGDNPSPDPTASNQLEWDIERNYLPAPGHPTLGTPFALAVDGSEPTTDQLEVDSSAATSARVFAEPDAAAFRARARPLLRVAPEAGGPGRALVMPLSHVVLDDDGAATQAALRVLPVDLFANVADPSSPITVTLAMSGPATIVSPDTDANDRTETLTLSDAEGATIVVDDDGTGTATLRLTIGSNPVQTLRLGVGAGADFDGDGVDDDGNGSALSGDFACDAASASCDDNCPGVLNPSQFDDNHDGLGNCCDGTCIDDPLADGCDECALPAGPTVAPLTSTKLGVRMGGGSSVDKVSIKVSFTLDPGASIAPDAETVMVALTQAGSGGYTATLSSAFTDLMKPTPNWRYVDSTGAVAGVRKAQVRGTTGNEYRLGLKAVATSIADLAAGGATLSITLGDDIVSGTLDCTGTAPRLKCTLVP